MTEAATKPLHVVFASAEAAPFVKTGGLGDVAGSLPHALVAAGAQVIVMVPKYSTIDDSYLSQMEHVTDFYVPLGWRNEYCGLERLVYDGITYLFVDNERYFKRDYPYGFFDDGERFAFFSKAICESLQHLPDGFTCDILHCNDWHTALAPVFLREFYQGLPLYENVRTVYSIHNIAFQGQYSDFVLDDILGLGSVEAAARQLRCDADSINYMLGAINYSDAITTVSPSYADEIRTPEYGEGLDGALCRRQNVLHGIVNGIDVARNDPAHDKRIAATYSIDDMAGKAVCKRAIQEELGLEVRDDRPLMVMVTRLTRQKGMDLVMYCLERILEGGVQVAILGTGDADYEDALRWYQSVYPGQMAARIEFDPALSQRMYAGADMFLMPSLFEPCGLSQMIAMRYGTLPIVRETGGLRDTVSPYNQFTGEGNGFSFAHFNGEEMGDTVFRAARLFWDEPSEWKKLVQHAMSCDFSWTSSAARYLDLYLTLHPDCSLPAPKPKPSPKPAAKKRTTKAAKATPAAPEAPATSPASETEDATPSKDAPAAPAKTKATRTRKAAPPAKRTTTAKKKEQQDDETVKTTADTTPVEKPAAKPATRKTSAKTGAQASNKTTTARAKSTTATAKTSTTKTASKTGADASTKAANATASKPAAKATATPTASKASSTEAKDTEPPAKSVRARKSSTTHKASSTTSKGRGRSTSK